MRRVLTPLLSLGLLVAQCEPAAAEMPQKTRGHSPNPDRGMYVFQAYCVACHGQNGNGDGPVAGKLYADFAVRPVDLSADSFQNSHTDEQIATTVRGGGKATHRSAYMPAWGTTITDQQVSDLVAFVRELKPSANETQATIVNLGDPLELGRVLYSVRCLVCHGSTGRGDGPFLQGLAAESTAQARSLPDFTRSDFLRNQTDVDLENVLYSGIGHSKMMREGRPGWWDRPLEKGEMSALILYLRALPLQPAKDQG